MCRYLCLCARVVFLSLPLFLFFYFARRYLLFWMCISLICMYELMWLCALLCLCAHWKPKRKWMRMRREWEREKNNRFSIRPDLCYCCASNANGKRDENEWREEKKWNVKWKHLKKKVQIIEDDDARLSYLHGNFLQFLIIIIIIGCFCCCCCAWIVVAWFFFFPKCFHSVYVVRERWSRKHWNLW